MSLHSIAMPSRPALAGVGRSLSSPFENWSRPAHTYETYDRMPPSPAYSSCADGSGPRMALPSIKSLLADVDAQSRSASQTQQRRDLDTPRVSPDVKGDGALLGHAHSRPPTATQLPPVSRLTLHSADRGDQTSPRQPALSPRSTSVASGSSSSYYSHYESQRSHPVPRLMSPPRAASRPPLAAPGTRHESFEGPSRYSTSQSALPPRSAASQHYPDHPYAFPPSAGQQQHSTYRQHSQHRRAPSSPLSETSSHSQQPLGSAGLASPMSAGSSSSVRDRYVCDQCSKPFSRPSSLKIHLHSHTGERPFTCTIQGCDKSFSVRSNLRRHLKTHA